MIVSCRVIHSSNFHKGEFQIQNMSVFKYFILLNVPVGGKGFILSVVYPYLSR